MARPTTKAVSRVEAQADRDWFAMPLQAVLEALSGTASGLSDDEAARRLAEHGANLLPRRKPPTLFEILLRQFRTR